MLINVVITAWENIIERNIRFLVYQLSSLVANNWERPATLAGRFIVVDTRNEFPIDWQWILLQEEFTCGFFAVVVG
jgi:hypothetical protein